MVYAIWNIDMWQLVLCTVCWLWCFSSWKTWFMLGLVQIFDGNCSECVIQCLSLKFPLCACSVVLWHLLVMRTFTVQLKMLGWTILIGYKQGDVVCSVYLLLHDLNFYGTNFPLPSRESWRVSFINHDWIMCVVHIGEDQSFLAWFTGWNWFKKTA